MNMAREAFDARFWRQVDRDPQQWTCWLWTGGTTPFGHGMAWRFDGTKSKAVLAHRMAWELTFGCPVPPNKNVCHRCDEPSCVNPAHLFLASQKENLQDMSRKGRGRKPNEVCKRGHKMAEVAHVRKTSRRHCRECFNIWQRQRRAEARSMTTTPCGRSEGVVH